MYDEVGVIINRATRPDLVTDPEIAGASVLAVIGADSNQAKNDVAGKSIFELPEDSDVINGAREALSKIKI